MKIVVTGAYGQLGGELCRQLGAAAIPLDIDTLDLTDGPAVIERMLAIRPEAIVNCAAYTQVDKAESEPEQCRAVNATAVEYLVQACGLLDCPLVQISTDYVFGAACPAPQCWGGSSTATPTERRGRGARTTRRRRKAFMRERSWKASRPPHAIRSTSSSARADSTPRLPTLGRRTSSAPCCGLAPMRPELRIVADQHCTPTYVPHLARAIAFLAGADGSRPAPWGTYHVTNTGQTTWFDFAAEIFRQAGMAVALRPITTAEYGAPASRPSYSVLDTAAYHRLGGPPMPDWKAALAEYFAEWKEL